MQKLLSVCHFPHLRPEGDHHTLSFRLILPLFFHRDLRLGYQHKNGVTDLGEMQMVTSSELELPVLGMLSSFFSEFACLWVFRKFQ